MLPPSERDGNPQVQALLSGVSQVSDRGSPIYTLAHVLSPPGQTERRYTSTGWLALVPKGKRGASAG